MVTGGRRSIGFVVSVFVVNAALFSIDAAATNLLLLISLGGRAGGKGHKPADPVVCGDNKAAVGSERFFFLDT